MDDKKLVTFLFTCLFGSVFICVVLLGTLIQTERARLKLEQEAARLNQQITDVEIIN